MSEVKVYRVIGRIAKPNLKTIFRKEIRAVKPEDAVEEVYKILGSKHRVKRFHIKIERVEVIENPDEIRDPTIRALTLGE
ncbi:MAG: 50S ribosomal protein LX [Candidatus Bathyarchaeota archaeon B26-2]|nr:MAG: 50S ribosomal protein LX [Candidatus Bathyarchaeota archaeon B26-2]